MSLFIFLTELMIFPEILIFVYPIKQFPVKNGPFLNNIILVLSSFTIILFFEENPKRPSTCFWIPAKESEKKMRSSAQSKWERIVSPIQTPACFVRSHQDPRYTS